MLDLRAGRRPGRASSRTGVRSRTSATAIEPLVGRVVARRRSRTGGPRRRAGRRRDLEVRQPPHLQAAGDHRVQPAELHVLGEASRSSGSRTAIQYGRTPSSSARRNVSTSIGAPDARIRATRRIGAGQRGVGERGGQLAGERVGVVDGLAGRQREVQVDDDGVRAATVPTASAAAASASAEVAVVEPATATTCTVRPSWTYAARTTPSCADPLDRSARGRGSCSSGGSAPRAAAPGVGVRRTGPSSARIGSSGSGQATSCSIWSALVGRRRRARRRAACIVADDLGPGPIDVRAVEAAVPHARGRGWRSPGTAAGSPRSAGRASPAAPARRGDDRGRSSSRATTIGQLLVAPLLGDEDAQQRLLERRARRRGRSRRSGRAARSEPSPNHAGRPSRSTSSERR